MAFIPMEGWRERKGGLLGANAGGFGFAESPPGPVGAEAVGPATLKTAANALGIFEGEGEGNFSEKISFWLCMPEIEAKLISARGEGVAGNGQFPGEGPTGMACGGGWAESSCAE